MKKGNYNGIKIAAIYGSVFLGAGFASGQELLRYFVGFGRLGLLGIIIAGIVFALTGWAVLRICTRHSLTNYHGLMRHLFGTKLGGLMEGAVVAFLFCLFVAMLAGAGATGREAFNFPFTAGSVAVGVAVFFVLCFGLRGIINVNVFLAPFMLVGGIVIGLFTFFAYSHPVFSMVYGRNFGLAWLLAAFVYAAYNLVTGVPILAATAEIATEKRHAAIGGLLGGGVITLLGLCMALPLFLYHANVISLEIPFLYIVTQHGGGFRLFYLAVLITAIMTTAACNAFAVTQWLEAQGFASKVKVAAVLCVVGVVVSHIGFSNIVAYVYPVFGFLGIFKIIVILWRGFVRK